MIAPPAGCSTVPPSPGSRGSAVIQPAPNATVLHVGPLVLTGSAGRVVIAQVPAPPLPPAPPAALPPVPVVPAPPAPSLFAPLPPQPASRATIMMNPAVRCSIARPWTTS